MEKSCAWPCALAIPALGGWQGGVETDVSLWFAAQPVWPARTAPDQKETLLLSTERMIK